MEYSNLPLPHTLRPNKCRYCWTKGRDGWDFTSKKPIPQDHTSKLPGNETLSWFKLGLLLFPTNLKSLQKKKLKLAKKVYIHFSRALQGNSDTNKPFQFTSLITVQQIFNIRLFSTRAKAANSFNDLKSITLPKTNIAPTNGWLEYYFPIGEAYFQGRKC